MSFGSFWRPLNELDTLLVAISLTLNIWERIFRLLKFMNLTTQLLHVLMKVDGNSSVAIIE
jgi:hypothetical protein